MMPPRAQGLRRRGIPGEVTIDPCPAPGLLVRCPAHDGAGSLRELLLLRLSWAGTGPARDGLAPLLPPPPVYRPPPIGRLNWARPGGIRGWRFEAYAARQPLTKTARRRLSMRPPSCSGRSPVRMGSNPVT